MITASLTFLVFMILFSIFLKPTELFIACIEYSPAGANSGSAIDILLNFGSKIIFFNSF